MASILIALPMKNEMSAKGRAFVRELTEGRADEHDERHKLHGFKSLEIWRQHEPINAVVIRIEADDIDKMLHSRTSSDHAFEKWFDGVVQDVTGVDWAEPETEKLLDWHEEHGHRHKAAAVASPKKYRRATKA
jgi:hypothetical protein